MRIRPWVFAGVLLGAGSMPFADATVLYPEETETMREAWVRATSRVGRTDRARGEPGAPRPSFAPPQASDAVYRRFGGVPPC